MSDFSRLFVDTAYIQGLYNKGDQYHAVCRQGLPYARKAKHLFITDAILMEVGNAFSTIQRRTQGAKIIRDFLKSNRTTVIHLSPAYFEKALQLYEQRSDKEWGMVDCFSIIVMQEFKLTACLTIDHHFRKPDSRSSPFRISFHLLLTIAGLAFRTSCLRGPRPLCLCRVRRKQTSQQEQKPCHGRLGVRSVEQLSYEYSVWLLSDLAMKSRIPDNSR
jgi:hypothetical protein